jgi:hypothetical protein
MSDIAKFIVYENDEYIYFEPVSDKEDAFTVSSENDVIS